MHTPKSEFIKNADMHKFIKCEGYEHFRPAIIDNTQSTSIKQEQETKNNFKSHSFKPWEMGLQIGKNLRNPWSWFQITNLLPEYDTVLNYKRWKLRIGKYVADKFVKLTEIEFKFSNNERKRIYYNNHAALKNCNVIDKDFKLVIDFKQQHPFAEAWNGFVLTDSAKGSKPGATDFLGPKYVLRFIFLYYRRVRVMRTIF